MREIPLERFFTALDCNLVKNHFWRGNWENCCQGPLFLIKQLVSWMYVIVISWSSKINRKRRTTRARKEVVTASGQEVLDIQCLFTALFLDLFSFCFSCEMKMMLMRSWCRLMDFVLSATLTLIDLSFLLHHHHTLHSFPDQEVALGQPVPSLFLFSLFHDLSLSTLFLHVIFAV